MTKDAIEKLIDQQQRISDRNYMNYQQTGEGRYLRAHERAEDLIDIARIALNAHDDHTKMINYRCELGQLGSEACEVLHHGVQADLEGAENVLRNLRAVAVGSGIITDR